MRPRIVIPVPTSADTEYNHRSWPQYARAVEAAGGEAVALPLALSAAGMAALVRSCAGICLPGSPADVEPERYGAEREPATAAPDPAREAADYLLLAEAWALGLPVLGICFGCQSLNVWRGGTLVQDLLPLPVNHAAGGSVAIAHTAVIAADSLLGRLLLADGEAADEAIRDGATLRLPINSSHHQAVLAPGDDLRLVARSGEDGVAEAIELQERPASGAALRTGALGAASERETTPAFVVGVQWHPERSVEHSAASRALFAGLIAEAEHWQRSAQGIKE